MSNWDDWKERNADWWTPFVAGPLVVALVLAYATAYAIFWMPYVAVSYLKERLTR